MYHGTYPPGNALELTPRIKFTRSVWRNNSMTHRGYVGDGTGAFGGVCVQIYSTGCEAFFNECLIEGTRQNARWEQGAIAVFGNNRDNFWLETTVENSVFRSHTATRSTRRCDHAFPSPSLIPLLLCSCFSLQ